MYRVLGIVCLLAVNLMAASDGAVKPFSGSGTFDDPYLISNFKELQLMLPYNDSVYGTYRHKGGSYFKLKNDIVMDSGYAWRLSGKKPFFFDGGNHKITDVQGGRNFPLFSTVSEDSWIINLKLEASQTVEGGGILAEATGRGVYIVNVSVSGKVKCVNDCGGLVGSASKYNIFANVTNYADLVDDSSSNEKFIGGIVGRIDDPDKGLIVYASNYGNITGSPVKREWLGTVYKGHAGGIAGNVNNIKVAFNRGTVKNALLQGGIAGNAANAFYVYNAGLVEKLNDSARVGNLFGENTSNAAYIEENGLVFKGLFYDKKSGENGAIGYLAKFLDVEDSGAVSHDDFKDKKLLEKLGGFFIADASGENDGYPVFKKFFEGEGSAEKPFLLKSKEDLLTYNRLMSDPDIRYYYAFQNYKLMVDVKLDSTDVWIPSILFGIFDGGGHTIKGLRTQKGLSSSGVFSQVVGEVKNLGIVDSYIEGEYAGGIAGKLSGSINNCWNKNTHVWGIYAAGGIVGSLVYGTISINRVYNTGTVRSKYNAGGILGEYGSSTSYYPKTATVSNCYNKGLVQAVDGDEAYAIVGSAMSLQNCYNVGVVEGQGGSKPAYDKALSYCEKENIWTLSGPTKSECILSEEYMKSKEFAKKLGEGFAYDSLKVNGGYPILSGKDVKYVSIEKKLDRVKNIANSLKVTVQSQKLFVEGLKSGEKLALVDLKGKIIWTGRASGASLKIPVNRCGVYLLKSARSLSKVFVR